MRRRKFITLLSGAAAAWPLSAHPQQRSRAYRIGVIMIYAESDPEGQERLFALREQLRKLGWGEPDQVRIEVRWGAGKENLFNAYAREIVGLPADSIIVSSTPVLATVKALTHTIPFVSPQ